MWARFNGVPRVSHGAWVEGFAGCISAAAEFDVRWSGAVADPGRGRFAILEVGMPARPVFTLRLGGPNSIVPRFSEGSNRSYLPL